MGFTTDLQGTGGPGETNGRVVVIGAGLAGSEAAWQAAQAGTWVELWEMRPQVMTPAHQTGDCAELVCSNSLHSNRLESASGLLKEELRRLDSVILAAADAHAVPAGQALAVERRAFAQDVTARLQAHPRIRMVRRERQALLPLDAVTVVATGPLTSPALAKDIAAFVGTDFLYFYDAAAPIVTAESIDYSRAFWGSRYQRGQADYLNCPLSEEEYRAFWQALVEAEQAPLEAADAEMHYFEGCLPVEVMARRGPETLAYGPLKPVGLRDPRTGKRPYAVVQLRREDREGRLFNLVGFQTRLKWGEQERVFRMIPALANAEFVRFGVMHRNTFLNAPQVLLPTYQSRREPRLFFAGQMTGVEGYIESCASGLIAGRNAARLAQGLEPLAFPRETMLGAMARFITEADPGNFQPMNATLALLPPLEPAVRDKRRRHQLLAERALQALERFIRGL